MNRITCYLTAFACSLVAILPSQADSPSPRSRSFRFTYAATIVDLPADSTARIWVPVPSNSVDQEVEITSTLPKGARIDTEPEYGNRILFWEARPDRDGKVAIQLDYRVTRREVKADLEKAGDAKDKLDRFLLPDALVPVDGKPLELLEGKRLPDDPTELARALYDVVHSHLRYSKDGEGWGKGDATWACKSGYGNCTDFHSLFISLARARKIPARFEIGFSLPEQRGKGDVAGYHCWASFRPEGKGWIPVDISEASKNPKRKDYYFGNLTEDRVTFSVGRDLTLVPRHEGARINYFVYPYVETSGKPWPSAKIQNAFRFVDLD